MEIKATVPFYIRTKMETLNVRDIKCKAESSGRFGPLKHCVNITPIEVEAEVEAE
jgi:hypothetical protein